MKEQPSTNQLCISCRRGCKQTAAAVVSLCPRYYPLPPIKRESWRQLDLDLFSEPKRGNGR